jgi:RNA polymerase sigma-70 factor, ECF subfamily
MTAAHAHVRNIAETVARHSYGRLVAVLSARMNDVNLAEDALAEAFATALKTWPRDGVPQRPEAWLITVAKRKMLDTLRQQRVSHRAADHLRLISEELESVSATEPWPDNRLALMFACAHPAIAVNLRAPLILQTILGFDAAVIASAFLTSPSAMSQRLVRAKTKIRQASIPFRVPSGPDLAERLEAVLDAIYMSFAEGYSDPAGTEVRRRELAQEGIWLGRLVTSLLPEEPEALGLLALMLHAEARRAARRDALGHYVPLPQQDPRTWDQSMIDEAESLLWRAGSMGRVGRYQLEAAVQSAHAVRRRTGAPDWAAIETLYDALYAVTGSPVVAINRAVAIAERRGPRDALDALNALEADGRLSQYQPYWAARAEMLSRTGALLPADDAYQRAIGLESDPAVRRFLQRRRERLQHA